MSQFSLLFIVFALLVTKRLCAFTRRSVWRRCIQWFNHDYKVAFFSVSAVLKSLSFAEVYVWCLSLIFLPLSSLFFSYMALGIALRYVLEALRKPFGSKMYMFGIAALDRFKTR